jgi:hypothetical protein
MVTSAGAARLLCSPSYQYFEKPQWLWLSSSLFCWPPELKVEL